jgi:hypothetical protein
MLAPRVWFCMKGSLDFPCLWHFRFPRVWPALYLTWIGLLGMLLNNITKVSEVCGVICNLSNVWPIVVGEWIAPSYFIFWGSRFHISALGPDILTDVLGFWSDFLENSAAVLHIRLHICVPYLVIIFLIMFWQNFLNTSSFAKGIVLPFSKAVQKLTLQTILYIVWIMFLVTGSGGS